MRSDRPLKAGQGDLKARIDILWIAVIAFFAFYASYLFYLQVIKGGEFQTRARSISRQTTLLPAQRGEIYDRDYKLPFVINTDSFAVELTPAEIPAARREEVFNRLADALSIPVSEITKRVPPSYYRLYQPISIMSQVPYSTISSIAERIDEFPGVSWYVKPVRNYLENGSISHVLGYVGDITRDELKLLYNQGYQSGDVIGKAGIEKQYDKLLRGRDGHEYRTVDVHGKQVESGQGVVDPPVMGNNLVLTIDSKIQDVAEKALGNRMGSVVVLKPATGEVLALVSYPWYDPNLFSGIDAGNSYMRLLADPNTPLIDRAIQSSYPPASTFKTIMTAGVLEEKCFPTDQKILCTGKVSYGDRVFNCWTHSGQGWLDLKHALEMSCDIYFWQVGRENLGVERIVNYASEFGYGKATGIDLPGEISGFIPTPQWKERRFHEKWTGGDTMNISIGQGSLLVTPLQMADTMAMICNGGIVYRPHVLKEIRDPASGAIVRQIQPEVLIRSRISPETFQTLRENMRGVVAEGTARVPVNTKAVEIAGKTGTAEVGLKDHWHSWFASFAPAFPQDPNEAIAVVVMVEASNTWEWWAPYASNIIYQSVFAHQTYDEAVDSLGLRYLIPRAGGRVE